MRMIDVIAKGHGKKLLFLLMMLFLTGCSVIPDMPGPIGIPGI